jgi:Ca-activated chloride channel family protein
MQRLLLLSLTVLLLAASPDRAREANQAYERGDYAEAAEGYRQAIASDPGDARLHFNLGNALARMGEAGQAAEAWERFRALARTPEERALADYNIGNVLAGNQEWKEAAERFRQALRQNPADPDAAHNYEFALRQLQYQDGSRDQQQPDSETGRNDTGTDPQRGQQQDSGDGDGNGDASRDQDEGRDEQQPGQPGDASADPPAEGQPQPLPEGMTQEEAEQLLNAISSREQELIREFLKDLVDPGQTSDKDW